MVGSQHLHFIPIYKRSVRYRPILSNLFWIYATVIDFPEWGGGGDHGLMWGINRFQSHSISPALGNISLNFSLFGKAKHLTGFRMPFSILTHTVWNISCFFVCKVFCFSHNQRQYVWISQMNINEEPFESVLHGCLLITFKRDFHKFKNLGLLNVARCRNVSIPFSPYSPCSPFLSFTWLIHFDFLAHLQCSRYVLKFCTRFS